MTGISRVAGSICWITLGLTVATSATEPPGAPLPERVVLAAGERILVMRVPDYQAASKVVDGTGNALTQSVYNALDERGLTPLPGSSAALANATEECSRVSCSYLVLARLERYTPRSTTRSTVGVAIDLIEASSTRILATCEADEHNWRHKSRRVQELVRPAVEACLERLITVRTAAAHASLPALDEFLVVHSRELWVLNQKNDFPRPDTLAIALLESLKRAEYRCELGPTGLKSKELFKRAREAKYNRILSVGSGLVWTRIDLPPDDAPPQLIVSLVDTTTEEILRSVVAESADPSWNVEGSALLPRLMQAAVWRLLGRPDTAGAPAIEGLALSLLEPATVIEQIDVDLPRSARRLRPKPRGTVVVDLVVDERGQVVDSRIAESVPALDRAVLRAARRLRFLPARRDGAVCPMHLSVQYAIESPW